ncbi:phosphatidate cytidylyltransferase [bacterium]|nr:phosphatidate cytidylyltransferase [bacterium]
MLLTRIAVSVFCIPIFLLLAYNGRMAFALFVGTVSVAAFLEFANLVKHVKRDIPKFVGALGCVCMVFSFYRGEQVLAGVILFVALLLILTFQLLKNDISDSIVITGITSFGIIYTGWFLAHLVALRNLPLGKKYVFTLLAITWLTDSGAYAVGTLFGKHKLPIKASPNKSYEGLIGACTGSFVGVIIAKLMFLKTLTVVHMIALAIIMFLVGQLGDLAESLLKRDAKVKDTDSSIPGHGGVLDRFDSLLFTAPAMFYYVKLFL